MNLRLLCAKLFLSHVLEKLIIFETFHAKDKNVEVSEEQIVEVKEWVLKVCRFVINICRPGICYAFARLS